jgi:hypothetical protein
MSTPSNLYAEKIFAEQPTALWALDDNVDYLSFISEETHRKMYQWDISGGTGTVVTDIDAPFPDSYISKISAPLPDPLTTTFGQVTVAKAITGLNGSVMNSALETFSIGLYVYANHPYTTSFKLGYGYTDPTTSQFVEKYKSFIPSVDSQWNYLSQTFTVPANAATITVFFTATFAYNATQEDYEYFLNGLSIGQWSEEFSVGSLGIEPSRVVSIPGYSPSATGIRAETYGLEDSPGYYMSASNTLYAKNTSVPMVYGSSNVTRLLPKTNSPSLIIPGKGFLNEIGRYRGYTLETWIRVDNRSSNVYRRLFGPTATSDGVYLEGPFVKLKIGDSVGTHFVGEWYRPMLMQLKVGIGFASLLINSEEVIFIDVDTDNVTLASSSNDWIGFYAYADVPSVEVDCVAIYPYQVPAVLAKRRFAFGQAVESPEGANRSFGGQLTSIDYKFADYTNNYSYPDVGNWNQGILENLIIDDGALSVPKYSVPEVVLQSNTMAQWEAQLETENDTDNNFIYFGSMPGHILIDKFNVSNQDTKAIYAIISTETLPSTEQVIIFIEKESDGSYFQMSWLNDKLIYKFKSGTSTQVTTLYEQPGMVAGENLFCGIHVDGLASYFGGEVASFFGNTNQLKIYALNNKTFSKGFTGKAYKVALCSQRNFAKIAEFFDDLDFVVAGDINAGDEYFGNDPAFWLSVLDGGTPSSFNASFTGDLFLHRATYTLFLKTVFDSLKLDIAVDSYWEDYIPLSYFAQYVSNQFGDKYYDLDFIQFNMSYPDTSIFTGSLLDTSNELVKAYITFQYLSTGANAQQSAFLQTELPPIDGIIEPGENWMTTRYEVVNGDVIYPPVGVDINSLAIVTHLEIGVDGIVDEPLVIKKLEYASQAFNENNANPVGTRFGLPLFPYTRYKVAYDYTTRNPYRIYKGSTPHLYLTKDSGIKVMGQVSKLFSRGLIVPVNSAAAPEYNVIGVQLFFRSSEPYFSREAVPILEIQGTEEYLRFYIQANDYSGKRARIYAINTKTGAIQNGIAFYINGNLVREPVISLDEWTALGIAFAKPFNFKEYAGSIRLTGSFLFNNIAYYESSSLQETQRQTKRTWFNVLDTYDNWLNVLKTSSGVNYNWGDILIVSTSSFYGIDPENIYNAYTGTNKIIVDDSANFSIGGYEYNVITDVEWQSFVETPV